MNSKPQVLIVDNNASMLGLLSNLLINDYEVVTKFNPIDAYNWLQEGNYPALAIIDLNIANTGGFPLVRNLKISGMYRDMPVIMLSSNQNPDILLKSSVEQANALFPKPFNPVQLKSTIRNLISIRYSYAA